MVDSPQFGRMLCLDGVIQTTIRDEPAYYEMIAHVLPACPSCPKKVLIIDAATEALWWMCCGHPEVGKGPLVEIDEQVIEASFGGISVELAVGFDDGVPRCTSPMGSNMSRSCRLL